MSEKMNRRNFIKTGSASLVALGAAAGIVPFTGSFLNAAPTTKSRVILARNLQAIDDRNVCNPTVVNALFDKALFTLTGQNTAKTAWTSLGLVPDDVVAVKINCNTWTIKLSPHMALVQALCKSLNSVIPLNNIIFYERSTSDLESGGFKANTSSEGVRFFGNDDGGGYHRSQAMTRIITDTATKIINLASMKCVEGGFGASLFFKNHIGSLRDEDMPKCHGDLDFLARVNTRRCIVQKTILNLMDALRGTYKRGVPWYWKGIIMGQDPVATEYAVVKVINDKRRQENIKPLPLPGHLELAEKKYKLGVCNPAKISIINA
ncbi:MAG: DUF362 domain-containing protein [bacterium]|nr:DUF362 domain-containing protein [bacterium]